MNHKRLRLFSLLALAVLLISLAGIPKPVQAADNTCIWIATMATQDFDWSNWRNWSCSSGIGQVPTADSIVTISSTFPTSPQVTGSALSKSLTLKSGYLIIAPLGALTVGATWTNDGDATIDSQGTIYGDGVVTNSNGTLHLLSSGTIHGNLTINSGATASVEVVTMHGDVLNNGALVGEGQNAQFHMLGQLFTNNGHVSLNAFYFEKGGSLAQDVVGSNGSWDNGINQLFVGNYTHLTLKSNVTFSSKHFSISNEGGQLDVGTYAVTFLAPYPGEVNVTDNDSIVGATGGSVHSDGEGVTIIVPNEGSFNPPLLASSAGQSQSIRKPH